MSVPQESLEAWPPERFQPKAVQEVARASYAQPAQDSKMPEMSSDTKNSNAVKGMLHAMNDAISAGIAEWTLPTPQGAELDAITEVFSFPSADGTYEIKARLFKPTETLGNRTPPLNVHLHGGGMTYLNMDIPYEVAHCIARARCGVAVLCVEFRNARDHAFPAGVDDCLSAVFWARESQDKLGVDDTLVVSGMSGGGNLALATMVRAIQQGRGSAIDGVYSDAPLISADYMSIPHERYSELITPRGLMTAMRQWYTESEEDSKDMAAWPLANADDAILKQFPPTCVVGEEFDLLHSDAAAFFDKLVALGVEGCSMITRAKEVHCQATFTKLVHPIIADHHAAHGASFVHAVQRHKHSK